MNLKMAKIVRKFASAFGLNADGLRKLKVEYAASNGDRRHAIKRELKLYSAKQRLQKIANESALALPKPKLILP